MPDGDRHLIASSQLLQVFLLSFFTFTFPFSFVKKTDDLELTHRIFFLLSAHQKLQEFEEASGIEFTHIRLLARAFTHAQVGFNNLTL